MRQFTLSIEYRQTIETNDNISRYMYVVESEDQNTELDKVNQNGTNANGVGNSAFTYDYTSNNGWVDE